MGKNFKTKDLITDKEIIRKEKLAWREKLGTLSRYRKSSKICKKILRTNEFQNALTIGFYFPTGKEVNIKPLIKEALFLGKRVCFPKLGKGKTMHFYGVDNWQSFQQNKLGILEPTTDYLINNDTIDLIIIPVVAYDEANNRVGMGMGYFDRYLATFNNRIFGVAYEKQGVKLIDTDDHDVPLDEIITERKF